MSLSFVIYNLYFMWYHLNLFHPDIKKLYTITMKIWHQRKILLSNTKKISLNDILVKLVVVDLTLHTLVKWTTSQFLFQLEFCFTNKFAETFRKVHLKSMPFFFLKKLNNALVCTYHLLNLNVGHKSSIPFYIFVVWYGKC